LDTRISAISLDLLNICDIITLHYRNETDKPLAVSIHSQGLVLFRTKLKHLINGVRKLR